MGNFFASTGVPEPKSFLELWIAVGFVASILGNVFQMVRGSQRQKREVSFSFTPASKEEFDKHALEDAQVHRELMAEIGRVDRGVVSRLAELPEMERRIDAKDEVRSKELHDRINDVLSAVSELRGEVHSTDKRISMIADAVKSR